MAIAASCSIGGPTLVSGQGACLTAPGRGKHPRSTLRRATTASLPILASVTPGAAQETLPIGHGLSYLHGFGPKAAPVVRQVYGLTGISLLVVVIVLVLVLFASFSRRVRPADGRLASVPLERSGRGLALIYIGSGISFLVLLGTGLWGYMVLADIAAPDGETALTIRVTGHQWWWEVEYPSAEPWRTFETANEMHIPVGQPVRVELRAADVIHSFWVPALAGKMDLIPSQENETWIQADVSGVYRGQCAEYCGQQHAHMAFDVTAETPEQFREWLDSQIKGAPAPPVAFMRNCAVCHAVRGTPAQGRVGPDLSHLMQRRTIAAGTLPNTVGTLSGWISNPQRIKPGNHMPTLTLTSRELDQIRDYLTTLR